MEILAKVRAWMSRRCALCWVAALSLALNAFALPTGLVLDDAFHAMALREGPDVLGAKRAPWDAYAFAKSPELNREMIDAGVFPWWSDLDARYSFLRPLTSLTLYLDHTLWPQLPVLMHIHSLVWYALLLVAVALVYRRFANTPAVAGLAFAIYALDDTRASTVGWIASRGALLALAGGFFTLCAHGRWRATGESRWLLIGLLSLGLGLAGAEAALQALGYVAAYALFLDRGPWRRRIATLAPYAVVVVAWRVLYVALGYGAVRTDLYIDPARDPLRFLATAVVRLPVLFAAQFAGLPTDVSDVMRYAAPELAWVVVPVCTLCTLALLLFSWPLLRARADARFWGLGTLLSTLPVCAVMPADRLMSATSLGGAALTALLLSAVLERARGYASRAMAIAGAALGVINLVVAPAMLPLRAYAHIYFDRYLVPAEETLPDGPEVVDKTVVLVNPPSDEYGIYQPFKRAVEGGHLPGELRWLATGDSALSLTRVDARTLRVRPQDAFLSEGSIWTLRSRAHRMAVGRRLDLTGVSFEVTDVTSDGRPAEALVRFDEPLEDERFVWLQWGTRPGYVPFVPPAAGETVHVPAIDPQTVLEAL